MCKPHVRQCPVCGFTRPYAWTYCHTYLKAQKPYVLLQTRTPHNPNDCEKFEKPTSSWIFPYPAIQCGNEECPARPYAEEVQAKCYKVAAEKKRRKEEFERREREEKERKVDIFANKYFRKIPVLSVKEQEKAWEEMMDRKEAEQREREKRMREQKQWAIEHRQMVMEQKGGVEQKSRVETPMMARGR